MYLKSLITEKLDSKIAGFTEQSPLDDDLLCCVETVPHDEGQAWKGM